MNLDNTNTYTRTVDAADSATAQEAVKALAKAEGYRVRTVRSVRRVDTWQDIGAGNPSCYRVELAVEL